VTVLDTHALIWWVAEPGKLSTRARRAAKAGAAAKDLAASAISIFEISTLIRRGRLELGVQADQWFRAMLSLPELGIEPVSGEIAQIAGAFSKDFPEDPADRIIAATAQVLRAKLITADDRLRSITSIDTIW
jgi:PIN domain nuclease of toxin-antitoxin system